MGSLIGQGIVGIALPALLALVLNGLVLRTSALTESRKWPFIGLIVAGCFVFSYSVIVGGIAFPPREATHWLPFIAVGAAVFRQHATVHQWRRSKHRPPDRGFGHRLERSSIANIRPLATSHFR